MTDVVKAAPICEIAVPCCTIAGVSPGLTDTFSCSPSDPASGAPFVDDGP
jgi:hypothetical protein